jgi:hypothetical protein
VRRVLDGQPKGEDAPLSEFVGVSSLREMNLPVASRDSCLGKDPPTLWVRRFPSAISAAADSAAACLEEYCAA